MKSVHVGSLVLVSALAACASTSQIEPHRLAEAERAYRVARENAVAEMIDNFERVHFVYDTAQVTPDSLPALALNVEILRQFGELELLIEGHCDENGSTEYNLALGERRAESIKRYMATAGVEGRRLSTISYGEERPLLEELGADARAINRRAEFTVRVRGVDEGSPIAALR